MDAPSSNVPAEPLTDSELQSINAYWRRCNYLAVGMIYLRDNPLLEKPLEKSNVKHRLSGHWGGSAALSLVYVHCDRLIRKYDFDMVFTAGPDRP